MEKLELARKLGIYHDGWDLAHYFRDAAEHYRWICMIKWGEKGGLKSNSMAQDGYTCFHQFDEFVPAVNRAGEPILDARTDKPILVGKITDWTDMAAWGLEPWDDGPNAGKIAGVKQSFVFRPRDFTQMLKEAMKADRRLTWVGWDDINIHLPRSMYFTKRKLWETLAKNWEGMRANMNIFECTAPRKDRVASFILGDMNWESLCSNQLSEATRRWFWESDYYDPEKVNKYRIDVEDKPVIQDRVPKEFWDWYWATKKSLIDESTEGMIETLEEIDNPQPSKPRSEPRDEVKAAQEARAKLAS